jgi:hypothetical protein
MSKGHKPAGGIKSRQITEKPVRTGVGARGLSKKWVSQIGASQGNHVGGIEGGGRELKGVRANPYKGPSMNPAKFGNEIALNVGKGGPGKGREVFKSGSQHGLQSPKPRPSGTFD